MKQYVDITPQDQNYLLRKAKKKMKCSWRKIAELLGVNRSMVFFYLSGSKMTYDRYIAICKLAEVRPDDFQFRKIRLSREKIITEATMGPELANFLGILAGDGHMNMTSYEVTIAGHKRLDKDFLEGHVKNLFKILFGLEAHIRFDKHRMICRVYSKRLVEHLFTSYDIPVGRKKGRLKIPKRVKKTKNLLMAYIRGLFDTDGSVYPHHKNSIALDITSRDVGFRRDIVEALKKMGFHPTMNGKNIQLYRRGEIDNFFKSIGPQNARHLKRYRTYTKLGYLPPAKVFYAAVV